MILQLKGNLNFSNSLVVIEDIEAKVQAVLEESPPASLRYVLLDVSGVSVMDPTACNNLVELSKELQSKYFLKLATAGACGEVLIMMERILVFINPLSFLFSGSLWQLFRRCQVFDQIPVYRHYPTVQDALALLTDKLGKDR